MLVAQINDQHMGLPGPRHFLGNPTPPVREPTHSRPILPLLWSQWSEAMETWLSILRILLSTCPSVFSWFLLFFFSTPLHASLCSSYHFFSVFYLSFFLKLNAHEWCLKRSITYAVQICFSKSFLYLPPNTTTSITTVLENTHHS